MSKSPYRRASQSRPLLGKSDCFIQSPCSRQRIFIRVSARPQAPAAPEAPEPMISTSTISFTRPLLPPIPEQLTTEPRHHARLAQDAGGRYTGVLNGEEADMRQVRIGDITIDAVIEREGPWRRPQDFFPAYDDATFKRHLPVMEPEFFDTAL